VSSLRARYARSYLGQFWLMVTTLAQILVIGMVWAFIWQQPVDTFLPYYGVGQILFSFVMQTINEGTNALIGNATYYRNDKMAFSIAVLANLYQNMLIALHNLPIVIALLLWPESAKLDVDWRFLPAFIMMLIFTFLCSYFVSILCARFRDIIQLVGIILQNIFLLTPVMWKMELIPERFRLYILLNPFTAILETLRNPLVGLPVDPLTYFLLAAWGLVFLLACVAVRKRLGATLIFWI
jgi:lipopolysaccharide transport system permease protein